MDGDPDGVRRAQPSERQPLVVSRDSALVDELTRLCAAAALSAEVVVESTAVGSRWSRASCVLVDAPCAADIAALGLRRRDDVVVVGRQPPPDDLWRRAVQIGAVDVAVVPDDVARIADRLADASAGGRSRAPVVGVVGASGGAGASTVAAGLAAAYARRRQRSLLIDADALGGGIELLLGCEAVPGLRWGDIEVDGGRVPARALLAALPSVSGVSVLSVSSASGGELDRAALQTMVGAGRRACGLVVVDLPRGWDASSAGVGGPDLDVLFVVAVTEVRSVAAGRQIVTAAARSCADVRAVVRTTPGRSIEADAVADSLGVELVAAIPTRRAVRRAVDDGIGVDGGWRVRRHYDRLLAALLGADGVR
jgi:secretion/DNA translocation related CpaE-like protein